MIKYNLHISQRLLCYPVSRVICMLCIPNYFAISFFRFILAKNRYMLVIEYFSQDKMIYTKSVFSPSLKENCSNIIIRFLINYRRQIPQLYFVENTKLLKCIVLKYILCWLWVIFIAILCLKSHN